MTDHPITPPPHLMNQWESEAVEECRSKQNYFGFERETLKLIKAARWGANRELGACCEWLGQNCGRWDLPAALRAARRPEPPSLKEQALTALSEADQGLNESEWQQRSDTIRRALESLSD